jgi:pyruvate,water dikinase
LAAVQSDDAVSAWNTIHRSPDLQPLKDALDRHVEQFGDRGLEELKLETPTFRESPDRLITLLKSYCQVGTIDCMSEETEQAVRLEAERCIRSGLKNPFKCGVFAFVLLNARRAIAARENMRFARSRYFGIVRHLFRRLGAILASSDTLVSSDDIWYLTVDEVFGFVQGAASTKDLKGLVTLRRAEYQTFAIHSPSDRLCTVGSPYLGSRSTVEQSRREGRALRGIGCSAGVAEGIACVAPDPHVPLQNHDTILIARSTDPGWVFLMVSSRGIVVEKGSVLSHTGIIGRELGIPTIVGATDATTIIPNGALVRIDGSTGEIEW